MFGLLVTPFVWAEPSFLGNNIFPFLVFHAAMNPTKNNYFKDTIVFFHSLTKIFLSCVW